MSFFLIGLLVLAAAAGGFYFWAQRQWPPTGYGRDRGQPTPTGMYLDQQSGLMLPQGTQLATPGRRIGAFFLAIPLVIITLGIGYLIWGLIVWPNGQTPALQVLGMRCFRPEDNRVAGFWWMALREIVAGFSEGTLTGGAGTSAGQAGTSAGGAGRSAGGTGALGAIIGLISLILMLTRPDRKTIQDLVAGTVVLYDPNNVLSRWLPLSGRAGHVSAAAPSATCCDAAKPASRWPTTAYHQSGSRTWPRAPAHSVSTRRATPQLTSADGTGEDRHTAPSRLDDLFQAVSDRKPPRSA